MAISFLESARTLNRVRVGVNDSDTTSSIMLKSKLFQPLVMTTENITKSGVAASTSKMSKDARLTLSIGAYVDDYFTIYDNHIVENKYSVPRVVKDYGFNNRTTVFIISRENMPGMVESSPFINTFEINLSGIAKLQDIDSVTCVFNSGTRETHIIAGWLSPSVGKRFIVSLVPGFNTDVTANDSIYIYFETPGESKKIVRRILFIDPADSASTTKIELPNRLNYPNGQPNLFGLLSECTIVVRSKTGGVIYETKLPKITPSNDFVYYYIGVNANVNGNKCTLVNPPSWYKGPMTFDFERQSPSNRLSWFPSRK